MNDDYVVMSLGSYLAEHDELLETRSINIALREENESLRMALDTAVQSHAEVQERLEEDEPCSS